VDGVARIVMPGLVPGIHVFMAWRTTPRPMENRHDADETAAARRAGPLRRDLLRQ
jgi:hypothetical protein